MNKKVEKTVSILRVGSKYSAYGKIRTTYKAY